MPESTRVLHQSHLWNTSRGIIPLSIVDPSDNIVASSTLYHRVISAAGIGFLSIDDDLLVFSVQAYAFLAKHPMPLSALIIIILGKVI